MYRSQAILLLTITEPKHGVLHEGNKEFSYQELSDGILYQHDGNADSDDFAVLQASDSADLLNVLLPINVQVSICSLSLTINMLFRFLSTFRLIVGRQ